MSSLSSYLASKYLTAESSTTKKRKRKTPKEQAGLIIADDDALGWSTPNKSTGDEDDDTPMTVNSGSAEFRKSKKNAWKVVGAPAPTSQQLDEAKAADAIIASAAAENAAAAHIDEEPAIEDDAGVAKMSDGTYAGLQTAAAVSAQLEKRRREERMQWEAEERAAGRDPKAKGKHREEETVYRDATGRRIDISMKRAEARREAEEKARKEREAKEAAMGDVQLAARAARREQLDEAKFMPLTRTADDEEINREMKEQSRWNDPAAMFLREKKEGKSVTGKPIYKGAYPPNRYGIRPGHRWDGVDRSNGWEGEIFKARNRVQRNRQLEFEWQMDE
jgi:pre-mRNA-splicing factor CWC26